MCNKYTFFTSAFSNFRTPARLNSNSGMHSTPAPSNHGNVGGFNTPRQRLPHILMSTPGNSYTHHSGEHLSVCLFVDLSGFLCVGLYDKLYLHIPPVKYTSIYNCTIIVSFSRRYGVRRSKNTGLIRKETSHSREKCRFLWQPCLQNLPVCFTLYLAHSQKSIVHQGTSILNLLKKT